MILKPIQHCVKNEFMWWKLGINYENLPVIKMSKYYITLLNSKESVKNLA